MEILKGGWNRRRRRNSLPVGEKQTSKFLRKKEKKPHTLASYSGAPSVLESENRRSLPDKITSAGKHLKLRKFCQEISGSPQVVQDETEGRGGECMSQCKKKTAANSWNATELRESTLLPPPGQWATRDALGSLAFPPNIPGIVSTDLQRAIREAPFPLATYPCKRKVLKLFRYRRGQPNSNVFSISLGLTSSNAWRIGGNV